jgi:hypothetical protein
VTTSTEYNRGYRAGRAHVSRVTTEAEIASAREAFIQELMIATMPTFLTIQSWQTGGKTWVTTEEYATGARRFCEVVADRQFFRTLIEGRRD